MSKKLSTLLMTAAFVVAMASGLLVMAPETATAQVFSAGDFSDGICSCPVDMGDCVCKWDT